MHADVPLPSVLYEPAAQAVQLDAPVVAALNAPALHAVQAVEVVLAATPLYLPTPQAVHIRLVLAPDKLLYRPLLVGVDVNVRARGREGWLRWECVSALLLTKHKLCMTHRHRGQERKTRSTLV